MGCDHSPRVVVCIAVCRDSVSIALGDTGNLAWRLTVAHLTHPSRLGRFVPLEGCLEGPAVARSGPAAPAPPKPIDPAVREAAEKVKAEGNALMVASDIEGATAKSVPPSPGAALVASVSWAEGAHTCGTAVQWGYPLNVAVWHPHAEPRAVMGAVRAREMRTDVSPATIALQILCRHCDVRRHPRVLWQPRCSTRQTQQARRGGGGLRCRRADRPNIL